MINPHVIIVCGSEKDIDVMNDCKKVLDEFGVSSSLSVASAHRTPERACNIAREARGKGAKVIIAGAGYAAHLAGAMAANTTLPVIGVPLDVSSLGGLDSLLSTVQMPSGVPVATVAIGRTGAKNAALLALQIIGTSDASIAKKLEDHKKNMAQSIEATSKKA